MHFTGIQVPVVFQIVSGGLKVFGGHPRCVPGGCRDFNGWFMGALRSVLGFQFTGRFQGISGEFKSIQVVSGCSRGFTGRRTNVLRDLKEAPWLSEVLQGRHRWFQGRFRCFRGFKGVLGVFKGFQ